MTRDNKQGDDGGPPKRRASDRRGSSPRKQRDYVQRATAGSHSGHGSDSVLPHLRDQLRLKALLPPGTPIPEPLAPKDPHHK